MIHSIRRNGHIEYAEVSAHCTGNPGIDDSIHPELKDKPLGAQSSIHLSDAAFYDDSRNTVDYAFIERTVSCLRLLKASVFLHYGTKNRNFRVHRADYADFFYALFHKMLFPVFISAAFYCNGK